MSIELREDKTLRINAYSLRDFGFDIAKAAKGGYSPVDDNDKYINGFSSWYTCGLVRDEDLTDAQRVAIGLDGTHYNAPLAKDETKATESVTIPVKTTRATKKTV